MIGFRARLGFLLPPGNLVGVDAAQCAEQLVGVLAEKRRTGDFGR